ncbi:pentapeptide repeat-containing protein [Rhodococcus sp. NPDC003318]|uniref:pentapeptide repeat-containing protein n=1 Tax=Rhodococcus sp. NPDC003318 TaxID=3364503 RepID=UPI0036CE88DC
MGHRAVDDRLDRGGAGDRRFRRLRRTRFRRARFRRARLRRTRFRRARFRCARLGFRGRGGRGPGLVGTRFVGTRFVAGLGCARVAGVVLDPGVASLPLGQLPGAVPRGLVGGDPGGGLRGGLLRRLRGRGGSGLLSGPLQVPVDEGLALALQPGDVVARGGELSLRRRLLRFDGRLLPGLLGERGARNDDGVLRVRLARLRGGGRLVGLLFRLAGGGVLVGLDRPGPLQRVEDGVLVGGENAHHLGAVEDVVRALRSDERGDGTDAGALPVGVGGELVEPHLG